MRCGVIVLALVIAWFSFTGASAEPLPASHAKQVIVNPKDLGLFLDDFFARQMRDNHVPGAVFVMVQGGKIVFMKGYGVSDLQTGAPVIPDRTLFRVGSISKLMTATAIMQLAARGQLSLNDDVNQYLKTFKLERNFPQPVTFANLLTHTAGFEDRGIGMSARKQSQVIPLGEYLARRMPHRVLPPGEFYSYSNHGMALAGYLVEVISGVPYAEYVDKNIFAPLEMKQSSFSLSPESSDNLVTDYMYKNGAYIPVPRHYLNIPPTGGLMTTAKDIAHFMIAHLQDGRYLNRRILSQSTAQEMHARHFTQDPRIAGSAYGFYERIQNNQRMIEHLGDVFCTSSLLVLMPKENLGFFVSYTRMDGARRENLVNQFLNRYFPVSAEPKMIHNPDDLKRFTGYYLYNRYARTTLEKLAALFAQCRLTAEKDGILRMTYPFDATKSIDLVEVGPLLFKRSDNGTLVAFKEDGRGQISQLFEGTHVFDRLTWFQALPVQLGLAVFFVLAFLVLCVTRLVRAFTHPMTLFQRLAFMVSLLNLCFLFGLASAYMKFDEFDWVFGVPKVIVLLLCIPIISSVGSAALLLVMAIKWKKGRGILMRELLISAVAVSFIAYLNYWNLLGFRY